MSFLGLVKLIVFSQNVLIIKRLSLKSNSISGITQNVAVALKMSFLILKMSFYGTQNVVFNTQNVVLTCHNLLTIK
jgi:hypothetical protein